MGKTETLYEYSVTLNPNSKRARCFAANYAYARNKSLDECYNTYSYNKEWAFKRIKEECEKIGGSGLKITGYCCNFFTAAYLAEDEEKGMQVLVYHTWINKYIIPINNCLLDILSGERSYI